MNRVEQKMLHLLVAIPQRSIVVIIKDIINSTNEVATKRVPGGGRPGGKKILLSNVLVVLLSLNVNLLKYLGGKKIRETKPADGSVDLSHTVGIREEIWAMVKMCLPALSKS